MGLEIERCTLGGRLISLTPLITMLTSVNFLTLRFVFVLTLRLLSYNPVEGKCHHFRKNKCIIIYLLICYIV